MSNIFQINSRFAALADDIPAKKDKKDNKKTISNDKKDENEDRFNSFKSDNNSFKNDGFRERKYNRYYIDRDREAQEKARKEEEEIRKQKALTPDNFPELVVNNKENKVSEEKNYLEKLKKVHETEDKNTDIDPDLKNILPGFILIKKDKSTNKIVIKEKIPKIKIPELKLPEQEENKEDEEIDINIINSLVELHERITKEFIELNGYDTWEKMFKFPDWREREREAELEDYSDEEYTDENEDTEDEHM
jgi:hypothetical protein